jgi:IgGFc binding protein
MRLKKSCSAALSTFAFKPALLAIAISAASSAFAAVDNKGSEFFIAFLPNPLSSGQQVELHLTADAPTTVHIEYPTGAPVFTSSVNLTPGSVSIVSLPVTASSTWSANNIQKNVVRAYSAANQEFIAYSINRKVETSDAALNLPVDALNTQYLVSAYNPRFVGSQFNVYAAYDQTTVTIKPKNNIVGHPAGVPFNIVLQKGEGYYGLSSTTNMITGNLIGTEISADKPIGVVNGNGCTQVPTGTIACDHIFEVAHPVQSWGKTAAVVNLPNRPAGTVYRVLASENNTTVSQDGVTISNLARGQFTEVGPLAGNHFFSADKPIFVTQYMTGNRSPSAISGDPAMGNMIPPPQFQKQYTFSTVGGNQFAQHFLTVIAENSDVGSITLDGVPIPPASFSAIPSSTLSGATLLLAEGSHQTASSSPHGVTVEGYNNFDSYLYPAGAAFEFINPIGDPYLPICQMTLNGDIFAANATDNKPTEDLNGNKILDAGEDTNGNGVIDRDTGIFAVELSPSATNLSLDVPAFVPGVPTLAFNVNILNDQQAASGLVTVKDGAGHVCTLDASFTPTAERICDIDQNQIVDVNDLSPIQDRLRQPATAPNDPMDVDHDGIISILDVRTCVLECDFEECASQ